MHEILMFLPTYHKKHEMFNLYKGFLRIRNTVIRNCELSDLKLKIGMKNYFQIVFFLLTQTFWRGVINRC